MGYFYAAMWLIVGLVLIFMVAKEHKAFYFAGGFFILLGIWWAVDAYLPENDLFAGSWGMALRAVTLVALVALSVVFFLERQRSIKQEMLGRKNGGEKAEADQPPFPETPGAQRPGGEDAPLRAGVSGVDIMHPQNRDEEE